MFFEGLIGAAKAGETERAAQQRERVPAKTEDVPGGGKLTFEIFPWYALITKTTLL